MTFVGLFITFLSLAEIMEKLWARMKWTKNICYHHRHLWNRSIQIQLEFSSKFNSIFSVYEFDRLTWNWSSKNVFDYRWIKLIEKTGNRCSITMLINWSLKTMTRSFSYCHSISNWYEIRRLVSPLRLMRKIPQNVDEIRNDIKIPICQNHQKTLCQRTLISM